ncbi:MAG: nitric-oxide reductase large subunit, partial [Gammaproteobacteria bacterium]|nr:nitric-oxide reductase large subunit [Gammaproteobacteria bacterium]
MQPTRRLWQLLALVFVLSFAVLGWMGREIYLAAPPIPQAVVLDDGSTLFTAADIRRGQQVWLAAGGQQLGSVWGHGGYVAPDWSADWLHREVLELRELQARRIHARSHEQLDLAERGALGATIVRDFRRNT